MKMTHANRIKTVLFSSIVLAFAHVSQGVAYYYQGGNANWTDSNWTDILITPLKNLPPGGASDDHNWGNSLMITAGSSSITINSPVVSNQGLGDRADCTINIENGGSLATASHFYVHNRADEVNTRIVNIQSSGALTVGSGSTGNLDIRAQTAGDISRVNVYGTLTMGRGFLNGAAITSGATAELNLYSGGTISGANTLFNVRGGMVVNINGGSFSTNVNFAYNNEGGRLNINGSGATIQLGNSAGEGINLSAVVAPSTPTLAYTFDAGGVSKINLGLVNFDNATDLILTVNADALTGATVGQQIELIDYASWQLEGVTGAGSFADYIAFTDLGTTIKGQLVYDTTNTKLLYEVTSTGSGPIVVAPAGVTVTIVGADVQLSFASVNGLWYQIEKSTDGMGTFSGAGFSKVQATGPSLSLTDTGGAPAAGQSAFYRINVTAD